MFSYEFCEIFKNTFFHRIPLVAASEYNSAWNKKYYQSFSIAKN